MGQEKKFKDMNDIERINYRMYKTEMTNDKVVDLSDGERIFKVDEKELLLCIVKTLDRVALALELMNKRGIRRCI